MGTSWDGLPDFGASIEGGPGPIFAAYNGGLARAIPDRVATATLGDGRADFRIDVVRPALPATTSPRGALRMRVAVSCAIDECLAAVRAVLPGASVAAAQPGGGFARLVSAGTAILPPDLAVPQYLDWTDLAAAQLIVPNLGRDSVELVKGALLGSTLLVWARLELDVPGVAARIAGKVVLSPKQLLATVVPATRKVAWDDLVAGLARGARALPVTLHAPAPVDDRRLGEILADRLRMAWGKLVPSAEGNVATIEFADPATLPDTVTWDLSTPVEARRPIVLQLDPLLAPRAMAAQGGLAQLVVEHTAPLLSAGLWEITAFGNLPDRREGVAAIGATLRVPAKLPARGQDIVQTIQLDPSTNRGTARIQLGPKEALAYAAAPFAVLQIGNDIRRLDAPAQPHKTTVLELGPQDFPVAFIPVSATQGLLGEAQVTGKLAYTDAEGRGVEVRFALSPAAPSTALPLPRDCTGQLIVSAAALGGGEPKNLDPLPAAPLELGPWSFPGYGPQQVAIEATFPPGTPAFAIDLLADGQPESPAAIATLELTPDTPATTWKYFARSAFHHGYRFRKYRSSGPPAAWSASQLPDKPLRVAAEAEPPPKPEAFDVEGVHFYVDPVTPSILRYLPAAPIPARAPNGSPLVSLIKLGAAGAFLQLSVRFDLEDAARDRLRVALSAEHFAVSAATLQPAAARITQITVQLAGTSGDPPKVIGTSSGSGVPPWDAIFNLELDVAEAASAARAIAGEAGILTITIHADVSSELADTLADRPMTIERTADIASWIAAG